MRRWARGGGGRAVPGKPGGWPWWVRGQLPWSLAQRLPVDPVLPLYCPPPPPLTPQVLDLRDNYRSCARIVATAQHVIAANDDWQRAALRPLRPPGHPIEACGAGQGGGWQAGAARSAAAVAGGPGRGAAAELPLPLLLPRPLQPALVTPMPCPPPRPCPGACAARQPGGGAVCGG
jgi:hypothetical protein